MTSTTAGARSVAILIFDDVEVLDFCGPFEVFSVTRTDEGEKLFDVFTVAKTRTIATRNGLSVNAAYTLEDAPDASIVIVPGGQGTRKEMHDEGVLHWVRERAGQAELVMSVCTGALVLGRAGLLDGMEATTHHGAFSLLRETAPCAEVREEKRFTDNGKILTSGGISAGIDLSFHVVARLHGREVALKTARYMEYEWRQD